MKRLLHPVVAGALVALAVAVLLLGQRLGSLELGGLERLERWSVDQRFRMRGPRPPGPDVAIVVFDDRTNAEAPLLFERRAGWAQLVRALHAAGAKVIAIDALFSDPERLLDAGIQADVDAFLAAAPPGADPAVALLRRIQTNLHGDDELEHALAEAGDVGLILALTNRPAPAEEGEGGILGRGRYGQATVGLNPPRRVGSILQSLPRFERQARALGFASVVEDETSVVREYELVLAHDEALYTPLAVQVVARFLGINRGKVAFLGPSREVRLGERAYSVGLHNEVLLDFRGDRPFPTFSAVDVIRGKVPPGALAGKIVWIGFSALGHDRVRTPFGDAPGVEVQATLADGLLREDFLHRSPATVDAVATGLLGLAVALLFQRRRIRSIAVQLAGAVALLGAYLGVTAWLFASRNLWCAWVGPGLAFALTTPTCLALAYLGEGLERRWLRQTFSRYLGDEVIRELLANPGRLALGGERRTLTVLFSDIRNFSTLSEPLAPEQVVALLNTYLTPMTRAVLREGGLLDKYIGDAVMAFFGAPVRQPDHAGRALASALAMHRELAALQPTFARMGIQIAIGIGINTGDMVVGNMGSEERFDYTVTGDAVNLASRIEGLTKGYGVFCLASEGTVRAAGPAFAFRPIDRVQVKGKQEVVEVHELLGGPGYTAASYAGLDRYEAALAAYRQGDFAAARAGFQGFFAQNPADTVSALYLERLATLGERAPEGWAGVYTHKTK